jgi:hypothetical protein
MEILEIRTHNIHTQFIGQLGLLLFGYMNLNLGDMIYFFFVT